LKEKLRPVEEMKDLARENVKLLEEKTVRLKKAKAKIKQKLGNLKINHA